ncbi:hypothetical protein SKAU_G00314130 [Synaphobranchus kaupii]|uniref:Uncharacterized protein n=1 Tax=Synaphobranchus kaupii TaxID=118154 RepID=A0A9Q1ESF9_SYNKA|nr:hypothetical protein SKAU_G00314130 [Synaphobranchus kaupii]
MWEKSPRALTHQAEDRARNAARITPALRPHYARQNSHRSSRGRGEQNPHPAGGFDLATAWPASGGPPQKRGMRVPHEPFGRFGHAVTAWSPWAVTRWLAYCSQRLPSVLGEAEPESNTEAQALVYDTRLRKRVLTRSRLKRLTCHTHAGTRSYCDRQQGAGRARNAHNSSGTDTKNKASHRGPSAQSIRPAPGEEYVRPSVPFNANKSLRRSPRNWVRIRHGRSWDAPRYAGSQGGGTDRLNSL